MERFTRWTASQNDGWWGKTEGLLVINILTFFFLNLFHCHERYANHSYDIQSNHVISLFRRHQHVFCWLQPKSNEAGSCNVDNSFLWIEEGLHMNMINLANYRLTTHDRYGSHWEWIKALHIPFFLIVQYLIVKRIFRFLRKCRKCKSRCGFRTTACGPAGDAVLNCATLLDIHDCRGYHKMYRINVNFIVSKESPTRRHILYTPLMLHLRYNHNKLSSMLVKGID